LVNVSKNDQTKTQPNPAPRIIKCGKSANNNIRFYIIEMAVLSVRTILNEYRNYLKIIIATR